MSDSSRLGAGETGEQQQTMGSTIRSRELTGEDWVGLHRPLFPPVLGAVPAALCYYVFFFLLILMAGSALLAMLGIRGEGWLPAFPPDTGEPALSILLMALFWAPLLLVPIYVAIRAYLRAYRRKRAIWLDLHERRVEVVEVEGARTMAIIDGQERCFFLSDLDDGRALLINAGSIPIDPDLLVAQLPAQEGDEDLESGNGWYPMRPDFPNSSFVLHRLPRTGHIVQLETRGLPLLPMKKLASSEIQLPALAVMASNADCGSLVLQQSFDEFV